MREPAYRSATAAGICTFVAQVALAVTLVYPFSKRFVAMPQAVLGIAFSFGIPMAFAAVRVGDSWSIDSLAGAVPALAWWLLFGNLFWVLAYDTEYAMVDRDDDLRIGIKTSAITLGRFDVAAVMAFYAAFHVTSRPNVVAAGYGWVVFAGTARPWLAAGQRRALPTVHCRSLSIAWQSPAAASAASACAAESDNRGRRSPWPMPSPTSR